jgi:hypothetical protein
MTAARARITGLLILIFIAGCGGGVVRADRQQRTLLSAEEMLAAGYPDAFTTVQSLRPQWLNKRGVSSLSARETVKVYLDGSLLGGPDQLRQITVRSIGTIQYLDGLEATQRWGLDHGLGAIMVSTRKGT